MRKAKKMYQGEMTKYQASRILFLVLLITAALSVNAYSQTKPLETAQSEASKTPGISVDYNESRYLTIARLTIDALADNEPLKKKAKTFEWTLESWFSVKGIDGKPVRVVLCADTKSKRFLFQRSTALTLTFGTDDILLGEGQRTSTFKGKARENVCWEVDRVIVDDLAKASSASFSVAGLRGVFSEDSLARFHAYGALVAVRE